MTRTIAFYAPLKSPDHPIPSGDREIARLMMRALRLAGYSVTLVSEVISYQKRPSQELYDKRRADVAAEEERITRLWQTDPDAAPDVWFTYHPYCKSPDWLGPGLSQRFDIPYVTAEACRTNQGGADDWLKGRSAVQDAVRKADANFVLKDSDWRYLETVLPDMKTAIRIPPFIDLSQQPRRSGNRGAPNKPPVILAAGMMRPGAKAKSYQWLAQALERVMDLDWTLVVAGDGPERDTIAGQLKFAGNERIRFLGSVAHEDMFGLMDRSDLFLWPGVGEAIGLVYLEAQSRGLPVVAFETAGVPLVVESGVGGLLSEADDVNALSRSVRKLLNDAALRDQLGKRGHDYVRDRHDVRAVARTFKSVIDSVVERRTTA